MSENSNTEDKALFANQNVKWYELGGKTKDAMQRAIEANESTDISNAERRQLARTLGQTFLVARNDTMYGYSAHAPDIFASPLPNEEDTFYMMCPIGGGRKDGETHFTPEDSTELSEEKIERIEGVLFMAWGGSVPALHKTPIQLQQPENGPAPEV